MLLGFMRQFRFFACPRAVGESSPDLRPKYAAIVLAIHFFLLGTLRIAAVPIQSQLVPALLQSTPGRPTRSLYIPPHKPPKSPAQRVGFKHLFLLGLWQGLTRGPRNGSLRTVYRL